jgi:hypothetical protein
MKKLILILFLLFAAFVLYNHQRLYLRDPLASVTFDGAKLDGVQVYINYSNDVMLLRESPPAFWTVVQHENHVGTPAAMKGMHWVGYLADADVVPLLTADTSATVDSMTGKAVTYHDGKHVTVVTLH